jgi:hypothetical protein
MVDTSFHFVSSLFSDLTATFLATGRSIATETFSSVYGQGLAPLD